MKKLCSLLLAVLLLCALFVGCQKTDPADAGTPGESVTVRVGSLKGPTSMGIVQLRKNSENGKAEQSDQFTMAVQADELAAALVGSELDVALVPANLAAVLYQKTKGGIAVINVNTLGVLDCVTGDENISSVRDLDGKTVVTTGQGTTPEYVLRYLLSQYGVDCTLEFRSEASEVAAVLKDDPTQIAVLPQPFATAACVQNDALHRAFSLTDEWDAVCEDSRLLTGVTVVRREFLEVHPDAVRCFLKEHEASVKAASDDPAATAELIAEYGIIEKAPIAQKALPLCNLVCLTGEEMQAALSGYLNVLYTQDASSVGGSLPGDDFYWLDR